MAGHPAKWKRATLTNHVQGNVQGDFRPEYGPHTLDALKDASPTDVFHSICTDEFLDLICRETRRYAQQKGNYTFDIDKDSLLKTLGILILSGYVKLPQHRMFWKRCPDIKYAAVTANMSRERFLEILRYIHFNNNMALDDETTSKIRPLIDHMNQKVPGACQTLRSKAVH